MTDRLDDLEHDLLLDGLQRRYGYEFRGYTLDSRRRRVEAARRRLRMSTIAEMQHHLLRDPTLFVDFLQGFLVPVTSFFREPDALALIQQEVFPYLRTFSSFKVWHAGCASGEEVVSLALLLDDAGLLDRARLYGTDIHGGALEAARAGRYDEDALREAWETYRQLGGRREVEEVFDVAEGLAEVPAQVRQHIFYADHNLVSDRPFGEMQLVLCRNTLIYFGLELQQHVVDLLERSLCRRGYLCLGERESLLRTSTVAFEAIGGSVYRKKGAANA